MAAAKRRFATSVTGKMCDSRGAGQPGAEAAAGTEEAEAEAEAAVVFARLLVRSVSPPPPVSPRPKGAGCVLSPPDLLLAGSRKTGPASRRTSLSGRLRRGLRGGDGGRPGLLKVIPSA